MGASQGNFPNRRGSEEITISNFKTYGQCRSEPNVDVSIFYPDKSELSKEEYNATVRAAKEICKRCSVQEYCLEYALDNIEPGAIMAGMTHIELGSLRRAKNKS